MKIYTYEGKANISGDRIHQARTAQRLSQDALAAKLQVAGLGIGREAISRIETGLRFVTDYELVIFARVLGVTIQAPCSQTPNGAVLFGSGTKRLDTLSPSSPPKPCCPFRR